MKIALFHTTLPEPGRKPGGVEIAVHRLANELARDPRDEVTVLSLTPAPADARYTHEYLFQDKAGLRDNQILRLFYLPFLLNFVDLKRFDVVHLHGDDWFLLSRGIPSVRTLHGSALFEARSATSIKRKISQYMVYPLEHLAGRLATRPLAVGPETAKIYGIADLANNGVNLDLFSVGEKAPHPQILYIGTWEGRKRGQFMFEQFTKHVLPRCPDAELVMVCDHEPAHPNVTCYRFPDDETLAGLYSKAWVFAYPSVYEGFGIPYIEAMASGTAVLCSPNDGAGYVLDGGAYGMIVEDQDFADQLVKLLTDEGLRAQMIEKGLSRAETFSWKAVARQHREMYAQAINGYKNGRNKRMNTNSGRADKVNAEEIYEH